MSWPPSHAHSPRFAALRMHAFSLRTMPYSTSREVLDHCMCLFRLAGQSSELVVQILASSLEFFIVVSINYAAPSVRTYH